MTWTRLSDDFTDRPDVLRLSRSARLLHVEALVYCNRHLTDGLLPDHALTRITDAPDLMGDVAELADAGLWSRTDGGWSVDWSQQETAEAVERRRDDNRVRQQRHNERKRRHARDDHTMCEPKFCPAIRNASGNALGNASNDTYPTRPVPTLREGRGGDGSASTRAPAPLRALPAAPPSEPQATSHHDPTWPGELPPGVIPTINGVPAIPERSTS
jgi:hypothetical protein